MQHTILWETFEGENFCRSVGSEHFVDKTFDEYQIKLYTCRWVGGTPKILLRKVSQVPLEIYAHEGFPL